MSRQERLQRLAQKLDNPLRNKENYELRYSHTKLGEGQRYIVLESKNDGKAELTSNVPGMQNPGFTFATEGSQLRTGPSLHVTTKLKDIRFGDDKTVNPLSQWLPPNIVNFYQPMVPYMEDLARISIAIGVLSGL